MIFFLLTSYSTAPRVTSSCIDNVELEVEKEEGSMWSGRWLKKLETISELLRETISELLREADDEESGTRWMERRFWRERQ